MDRKDDLQDFLVNGLTVLVVLHHIPYIHSSSFAPNTMGRRARTKQGPPEPLVDPRETSKPSRKELGKRKADPEPEESKRPAKKAKETSTNKTGTKNPKQPKDTTKTRGKKGQQGLATSWDDVDAEGSSGGWEDVEDDTDLKTQAK